MKHVLLTFVFILVLITPGMVVAQGDEFVPLSPIPGLTESREYPDLPVYLNAVFNAIITIASVLAVIMIMYHGVQYMIQEAVGEKKDALQGIRGAVFGLILLLMSWLILYVINPQILELSALKAGDPGTSQTPSGSSATPNPSDTSPTSGSGLRPNVIREGSIPR